MSAHLAKCCMKWADYRFQKTAKIVPLLERCGGSRFQMLFEDLTATLKQLIQLLFTSRYSAVLKE